MIVGGGSIYNGTKTLEGRRPRVTFSKDGHEWSTPTPVLTEGSGSGGSPGTMARPTASPTTPGARTTPAAKAAAATGKVEPGAADWKLKLFVSNDGVKDDLVTHLDVPGNPNESTVRFLPNGEMIALVRREAGSKLAWIGHSQAPYTEWTWTETKHQVGGPNFIRLPNGELWAAGRSYPGGAKTVVARMTTDSYERVLTLPSGGDTSYPGLVFHDGLLWMSYYSSHEKKSSIYLAKIKLPQE